MYVLATRPIWVLSLRSKTYNFGDRFSVFELEPELNARRCHGRRRVNGLKQSASFIVGIYWSRSSSSRYLLVCNTTLTSEFHHGETIELGTARTGLFFQTSWTQTVGFRFIVTIVLHDSFSSSKSAMIINILPRRIPSRWKKYNEQLLQACSIKLRDVYCSKMGKN